MHALLLVLPAPRGEASCGHRARSCHHHLCMCPHTRRLCRTQRHLVLCPHLLPPTVPATHLEEPRETGLATGWCDRRAERDRALRLALRGEGGLTGSSSPLEVRGDTQQGTGR